MFALRRAGSFLAISLIFITSALADEPFTYQGELNDNGSPVSGPVDLAFRLYDAANGGIQIGPELGFPAFTAFDDAGRFTVVLDFGAGAFSGAARWLEIRVGGAALSPRQPITSTPYADFAAAAPWNGLSGAPTAWSLNGNGGTSPGVNFVGTSDDQSLELHVNGTRALLLQPQATSPNLVGGYGGNSVTFGVSGAFIGGGGQSGTINQVEGNFGTVAGGRGNTAGDIDATIGGGILNSATNEGATVAGGSASTANGFYSTIGGGNSQYADAYASTISGGEQNTAFGSYGTVGGGNLNHAYGDYSLVAGGNGNEAHSYAGTIGGGTANYISDDYATIAGGRWNRVEAPLGTIGGGGYSGPTERNFVTDEGGTIAGGGSNTAGNENESKTDAYYATVGGGWDNTASNQYTAIGGGQGNVASGVASTAPGGWMNTASGDYSFAAGCQAQATHEGSFVWADSRTCTPFGSERDYQFRVRAYGGVRIDDEVNNWIDMLWNQAIDTSTGAYLSWGGTWTNSSDANLKENFAPVDRHEILEEVAQLPVQSWNYRAEDESVRHLGPTAQDFRAAFGLGEGETAISTVDEEGVALAAVQGLYELTLALEAEVSDLQAENLALSERLSVLERPRQGEHNP